MTTRPTFAEAKRKYVNRFTMDHIPDWSRKPANNGKFYAPQYRTDLEWYANTTFPPHSFDKKHAHSSNQSWPVGQWLDAPYRKV